MKKAVWMAVSLLPLGALAVEPELPPASLGEQQAEFTVRMFMNLCMSTHGEPDAVKDQAERLGFRPLLPEAASRFTGSSGGRAWSVQVTGGTWAVASGAEQVCTVYARRVDAAALRKRLVSWLPPSGSGFQTEEESHPVSDPPLNTVSYRIRRGEQPFAAWVLSTSTSEEAFFQGAVSLRMARP